MASSNKVPHVYGPFAQFVAASDWNAYTAVPPLTNFGYNVNNKLSTYTTSLGTKTFNYDANGKLESITGTGVYKNKAFTYNPNGTLDAISTT